MTTNRVERRDFGAIKRSTPTPQGGVRLDARPTKSGVLSYLSEDGTVRRELRPPEEVFRPESLATLQHAPLTDLHPPEGVSARNYREVTRGHVAENVRKDDADPTLVAADVLVQDAALVEDIDQGRKIELSSGYHCDLEMVAGVFEGQPYDAVQRNITYNHVAIGPAGWGRAGASASLRLDGLAPNEANMAAPEKTTKLIRIDGKDFEIGSDAHLAKMEEMHASALASAKSESEAQVKTATSRADAAEKELAELKKQTAPEAIRTLVAERVSLESVARKVLGKDARIDSATDEDLMRQVVTKRAPKMRLDSISKESLRVAFDAIKAMIDSFPDDEAGAAVAEGKMPAPGDEADMGTVPTAPEKKHDAAARARAATVGEGRNDGAPAFTSSYAEAAAKTNARIFGT